MLLGREGISDNLFIYYLVRSPEFRNFVIVREEGSCFPSVPALTLKEYMFPCPLYGEQRAIAHIPGSLDDKIELNRRMNQTLEAMAEAIFQSWFVDFAIQCTPRPKAEVRACRTSLPPCSLPALKSRNLVGFRRDGGCNQLVRRPGVLGSNPKH